MCCYVQMIVDVVRVVMCVVYQFVDGEQCQDQEWQDQLDCVWEKLEEWLQQCYYNVGVEVEMGVGENDECQCVGEGYLVLDLYFFVKQCLGIDDYVIIVC